MGLAVGQRDSGVSGAGHGVESGGVSWKARKCMNHRGVAVVVGSRKTSIKGHSPIYDTTISV